MSANLHRGTPGRALAIFAAGLAGIVTLSIHKWWERSDFEEVRFPTGLGDKLYYKPDNEDFSGSRLTLRLDNGKNQPLYRHNVESVSKKDERMLKQLWLPASELWLYSDSRQSEKEQKERLFLKTAPGEYIEFGLSPRPAQEPSASMASPTGAG
ncbi:MAG: hypothetical protein R3F19_35000 [Verrucomicrobiales bacterium]